MTARMRKTFGIATVAGVILGCAANQSLGDLIVWQDTFDVSADTFDINFETGTRQNGPLAPIAYDAITKLASDPSNDYHHQMYDGNPENQVLQLAGDANLTLNAPANLFRYPLMVSPLQSFVGPGPTGGIVGKKITFDLDVGTLFDTNSGVDPNNAFTQAGITIGASSTLVRNDGATGPGTYVGVHFVEDTTGQVGNYLVQIFDGTPQNAPGEFEFAAPVGTFANPAGAGPFSVQLDVDDPLDGDPWNGVGSTQVTVSVGGVELGSHTIGGGGLTSNFITLSASRDLVNQGLITHAFDNLTVHALPIPEPSSALLLVGVLLGLGMIKGGGRRG